MIAEGATTEALRLRFVATRFRPESSKLGMDLISALHRLHPDAFQLAPVGKLLHNADSMLRLEAGETPA